MFKCVLLLLDNIPFLDVFRSFWIIYLFRCVLLLLDNIPVQMCFALTG